MCHGGAIIYQHQSWPEKKQKLAYLSTTGNQRFCPTAELEVLLYLRECNKRSNPVEVEQEIRGLSVANNGV